MTISEFKQFFSNQLKPFSTTPSLDIQVLLEWVFKWSKTEILLHHNDEIPQEKLSILESAIEKRKTGLPIAYITGHKEFYGYDFLVSPDVLIPKPDTEILVERAIELVIEKMELHPNKILTICDMCTGSGCIAIAVMKTLVELYKIPESELPSFTLVDISPAALEIAQQNAKKLLPQLENKLHFVRSNLFDQFSQAGGYSFDLILTNPPYIPHTMVDELLQDGRSEPRLALDGDITLSGDKAYNENGDLADDGLEVIKNILSQVKVHLAPLSVMLMETGEYNAKAAVLEAESYGFKTTIHKDLEGQLRVVEIISPRLS